MADIFDIRSDRILLFRNDPDRNMHRFYALSVEPDLFGGARLVREWGRQGTVGRSMATHHEDQDLAQDALEKMRDRKRRRGYSII